MSENDQDNIYTSEYARCYDWIKSLQVPPIFGLSNTNTPIDSTGTDKKPTEWSLDPTMKHKRKFENYDHFAEGKFMTLREENNPEEDFILIGPGQNERQLSNTNAYSHHRKILQELKNGLKEDKKIDEHVFQSKEEFIPSKIEQPMEKKKSKNEQKTNHFDSTAAAGHIFPSDVFNQRAPLIVKENDKLKKERQSLPMDNSENYAKKHLLGLTSRPSQQSNRYSEYQLAFGPPPPSALQSARSAKESADELRKEAMNHRLHTHVGVGANQLPNQKLLSKPNQAQVDYEMQKLSSLDKKTYQELLEQLDPLQSFRYGRQTEKPKSRIALPPSDHGVIPSSADENLSNNPLASGRSMKSVYMDSYDSARPTPRPSTAQVKQRNNNNNIYNDNTTEMKNLEGIRPSTARSMKSQPLDDDYYSLWMDDLNSRRRLAKEYKQRNQDTRIWWTDQESRDFLLTDRNSIKSAPSFQKQANNVPNQISAKNIVDDKTLDSVSSTLSSSHSTEQSDNKSMKSGQISSSVVPPQRHLRPCSGSRIVPHSKGGSFNINTFA